MLLSRFSLTILLATLAILGGLWFYFSDGSLEKYIQNGDLLTLETRFTADEIIDRHRDELLGTPGIQGGRSLQEPIYQFHPYLLLHVKYYDKNHKTKQGMLIWSQMDGEMVLNTDTWEQTRGFSEAIQAGATPLEFRVLNALADGAKGSLSREKLQKEMNLEQEPLNALIESLKQKQLIVLKGNEVSLHFENPRFNVPPQTKITSSLVVKPHQQGKKLSPRYSRSKIEKIARAAFGNEFTILSSEEVHLPVIRLSLLNPDGSLLITDWNAITGNKLQIGPINR